MESQPVIRSEKNSWLTHEIALVAQHYPTRMPAAELAALLPRHPWISIREYGYRNLGLRRPRGCRPAPGWLRMRSLLVQTPMTARRIAEELGFSITRARELMQLHRAELRIVRWEWLNESRRPSAVWGIGSGPDARRPVGRRAAPTPRRRADPFEQLVAQVSI